MKKKYLNTQCFPQKTREVSPVWSKIVNSVLCLLSGNSLISIATIKANISFNINIFIDLKYQTISNDNFFLIIISQFICFCNSNIQFKRVINTNNWCCCLLGVCIFEEILLWSHLSLWFPNYLWKNVHLVFEVCQPILYIPFKAFYNKY